MKEKIAIALSGGVDSLVAAYLLKNQGYDVTGIHFITGYEHGKVQDSGKNNPELQKITQLAKQIEINIEFFDCRTQFKQIVINYFTQTYKAGKTPNPCIICNQSIKFGVVLEFAKKIGCTFLATGHYAGKMTGRDGMFHLLKGADTKKDQSYFLSMLSQKQLSCAIFPLYGFTKKEVIRLSEEKGLHPAVQKESQDICFIKDNDYADFLIRETGFSPNDGIIVDINGKRIGNHKGIHQFTVGQRRGINCPAPEPYYVISIDADANSVVVGSKNDLLTKHCKAANINWIAKSYTTELKVCTRIRYRNKEVPSVLFPEPGNCATIEFESPQSAVTPGQCAVFYIGDEVIGGGFIENA
ncbi:MnmA/TRMU family protein [Desulfobacterium sp. N47]|uniref:tRNA-specific 2-thiouridylase MnmA n=1 Tax=uncultured Desulfobacterium sp. TaxID=201089 RepID=E1YLS8_9BACT|nr:tRNA-specific 2-thiouridylase mnmA [uncultured Desulfobacterium sp.]